MKRIRIEMPKSRRKREWLEIGARALQRSGAALVWPTALSILAVTFRRGTAEMNRALGIFGALAGDAGSPTHDTSKEGEGIVA